MCRVTSTGRHCQSDGCCWRALSGPNPHRKRFLQNGTVHFPRAPGWRCPCRGSTPRIKAAHSTKIISLSDVANCSHEPTHLQPSRGARLMLGGAFLTQQVMLPEAVKVRPVQSGDFLPLVQCARQLVMSMSVLVLKSQPEAMSDRPTHRWCRKVRQVAGVFHSSSLSASPNPHRERL